jgi:alpha-N-arabinofuranosidase
VDSNVSASIIANSDFGRQEWDRRILGHFIEHFHTQIYGGLYEPGSPLSDENGFRIDVIEAMRELKVPIMRWPGGNYVSDHHWYDAVGSERVPSYNKAWRVVEPNTFGTDEFLKWCEVVGCEPYICTNGGNGSSEEMSNWVEYCNGKLDTRFSRMRAANGVPAPYAVKYWGIGNESYGDWQIGAKTITEWGPYAESAKMMRGVDEDIILAAAAVPDLDWTLFLLRSAGRYLDLISIHGYWDLIHQVNNPADYLTAVMQTTSPEKMIVQTRSVIDVAGFTGKIKIAFDEWNLRGWDHPDGNAQWKIDARDLNDIAATYTMADAIFSASFLNACLRHADIVTMANVAPTVNTRGPLFVHPKGVVRRTTFHTMAMYAQHLRKDIIASVVKSSELENGSQSVPAVDSIVSGDDTGITAILTNRHPKTAAACTMQLDGLELDGEFTVHILDGDSPDAFNDIENPARVAPREERVRIQKGTLTIPPHSIVVVSVSG